MIINKTRINRIMKDIGHAESHGFIFVDALPESQYMAFLVKKNGGNNTYVEDGLAAYSGKTLTRNKTHVNIITKMLYGYWYQTIGVLGSSTYMDEIMVHDPGNIRSELRMKPVKKINSKVFMNIIDFSKTVLNKYHIPTHYSPEYIIVLPHSDITKYVSKELIKSIYGKFIEELIRKNKIIAVKYHPREQEEDYLGISNDQLYNINNGVPMEVLYASIFDTPPTGVIGDLSTSLFTAKLFFNKKTKVISLAKLMYGNMVDKQLMKMFNDLGIITPSSMGELLASYPME